MQNGKSPSLGGETRECKIRHHCCRPNKLNATHPLWTSLSDCESDYLAAFGFVRPVKEVEVNFTTFGTPSTSQFDRA